MAAESKLTRWQRPALIVTAAAVVCYVAATAWAGVGEVTTALQAIGIAGLLVALGLSVVNYALRFVRWQSYMKALGYQLPWWWSAGTSAVS